MNRSTNYDYETFLKILNEVSEVTGIYSKEIIGEKRNANIVKARMLVSYFCRKNNFSLKYIALCMGNRNHTTIINQLEKFESDIKVDRDLMRLSINLKPIIEQRVSDLNWINNSGSL